MKSNNQFIFMAALLVLIVAAGCSQKNELSAEKQNAAFASSSPEVKADWNKATTALATNGYAVSILTFKRLQSAPDLTQEQRDIIAKNMTRAKDLLSAAVEKQDPQALQAADEIRKKWRSN